MLSRLLLKQQCIILFKPKIFASLTGTHIQTTKAFMEDVTRF